MLVHIYFGLTIKMVLKMEKGCQEYSSNFSFSIDASSKKAWTFLPRSFHHSELKSCILFLMYFSYPEIYDLLSLGYDRVLLCLKRSLRIANAAQQQANVTRGSSGPVTLFVEILNKLVFKTSMFLSKIWVQDFWHYIESVSGLRYLYFFEKGNPQITSSAIQSLIELIKTEMQSDTTTPDKASDAFFSSTLRYIQFQKQKGGLMGEKYGPIKVWYFYNSCGVFQIRYAEYIVS